MSVRQLLAGMSLSLWAGPVGLWPLGLPARVRLCWAWGLMVLLRKLTFLEGLQRSSCPPGLP